MDDCIIIFCTVPSRDIGLKIADDLVAGEFAACVNIIPGLTSVYRWKGAICKEEEELLVIKTRKQLFTAVCGRIRSLHPYEVPEIISSDISAGSEPYLKWISDSTRAR